MVPVLEEPQWNLRFLEAVTLYDAGRWEASRVILEALAARITGAREHQQFDIRVYSGLLAARRGDRAGAERTLHLLEQTTGQGRYAAARIAAVLGDRDRVASLLRDVLSDGGADLPMYVHRDSEWEPLREYSWFRELVRPRD